MTSYVCNDLLLLVSIYYFRLNISIITSEYYNAISRVTDFGLDNQGLYFR
jgi:hypothetical protein